MSNQVPEAQKSFRRTLLVPTLLLSFFLVFTIPFFTSTLLVDLAATFKVPIGTYSQVSVISSVMGLTMGLAMSAIALRFKHKSLLLSGVVLYGITALVVSFAQNFATIVTISFIGGAGGSMIAAMVYTLIAEHLPLERRGFVTGLVMSSVMAAVIVMGALSGFIAHIAGWRMVPLWFIFPLSLICLVLGAVSISSKQPQPQTSEKPSYGKALKKIFTNKSPCACCFAMMLAGTCGAIPTYAVSFFRMTYGFSQEVGGLLFSIAALGGVVGGAVGGRMINRFGRRSLAIWTSFIAGLTSVLFTFIPIVPLSVFVWDVNAFVGMMSLAALPSLTMEQVPEYRASMMSFNTAFDNAGTILIIIISGLILNLFSNNFHLVMIISGVMVASAGLLLLLFAKDPCKAASTR
jgi:predicted MFS family arabinose efflux permease